MDFDDHSYTTCAPAGYVNIERTNEIRINFEYVPEYAATCKAIAYNNFELFQRSLLSENHIKDYNSYYHMLIKKIDDVRFYRHFIQVAPAGFFLNHMAGMIKLAADHYNSCALQFLLNEMNVSPTFPIIRSTTPGYGSYDELISESLLDYMTHQMCLTCISFIPPFSSVPRMKQAINFVVEKMCACGIFYESCIQNYINIYGHHKCIIEILYELRGVFVAARRKYMPARFVGTYLAIVPADVIWYFAQFH